MDNKLLKTVLNNGYIFVDQRALKDNNVSSFLSSLLNTLIKHNKKIRVGLILSHNSSDEYKTLKLKDDDIDLSSFFYICSKVNFTNPSFDVLKKLFSKNNTLFITQDQYIAFEVSNLSADNNNIFVRRINESYMLESYPMIVGDVFNDRPLFSYICGRSPRIDKITQNFETPKSNSIVYINDKEVVLKDLIGVGGEGSVYNIDDEVVAKIYNEDKLTQTKSEKIAIMVKKRINDFSICWPINEIKNKENFIIGYTMKKCEGKPISSLYRGPVITKKIHPDFCKEDSINIVINILYKIKKLHNNNVLLGDINDRNFLINFKQRKVFLIDTDSYQLEDYCCEVGTMGYLAPELKQGVLSNSLRTFEDEGYGVAVFIFRTLMLGYFPFAKVGEGADYVELIKKQDFPYTLKDKTTKKNVPQIAYENWNEFPIMLKKMFIHTFNYDEQASAQNRYSVEQWINALEQYRSIIMSSK